MPSVLPVRGGCTGLFRRIRVPLVASDLCSVRAGFPQPVVEKNVMYMTNQ